MDDVFTNTKYNDKRKYPDDKLRKCSNTGEFAEETKKKGEFFTPREIVRLLVNLVEPKEKMKICDPTCGSGGMLIESRNYVERKRVNRF